MSLLRLGQQKNEAESKEEPQQTDSNFVGEDGEHQPSMEPILGKKVVSGMLFLFIAATECKIIIILS